MRSLIEQKNVCARLLFIFCACNFFLQLFALLFTTSQKVAWSREEKQKSGNLCVTNQDFLLSVLKWAEELRKI